MMISNGATTTRELGKGVSTLVKRELADDRHYHPNLGGITRGGLANHYPMTLLALHGLGASDAEVLAFRQRWSRHRAAVETDLGLVDRGAVTTENWFAFLGQADRLLEFRRVFEALLAESAPSAVVATALDVMRDSLPMGLFHPLIRLAFAFEQGDRGLIADALAYMAIRHADLLHSPALPAGGTLSPASVWRRIAREEVVVKPAGGALRVCEELCGSTELQRAALPADIDLSIPQICALALRLYLHEPALTTLHAVTSAQALAQLTADPALWARYWVWLTALYVEKGCPAELPGVVAPGALRADRGWPELAAEARAVPEVHLIKMAYSCRWLEERFGPEPLYELAVVNMLAEGDAHPRSGGGLITVPLE